MGRKRVWPPTIYKHKRSGRDYIRVRQDGRNVDIFLEGASGSPESKAHYARVIALMAAHGEQLPPAVAKGATVAEVVARFMDFAREEYDPKGREVENFVLSCRPLLRLFGEEPAAGFDAEGLLMLQKAMASGSWMTDDEKAKATKRKRPIGWCRNVVNRRVVRIKTLWKWAESRKLVPPGSYHHLQTVRGLAKKSRHVRHTAPRQATTWDDLQAVVKELHEPVATMIQVQWHAGMRSCEVRVMRPCDIDRNGSVWLYRPEHHKNEWRESGQQRVVALGPEAQKLLVPLLERAAPEAYLFESGPGRCYGAMSYAQAIRRACARAGVKLTSYQTRHAAKARITRAKGLDAARAVLGQKSIGTTNLYASAIDLEQAADVAKEVG
jgi:integrase